MNMVTASIIRFSPELMLFAVGFVLKSMERLEILRDESALPGMPFGDRPVIRRLAGVLCTNICCYDSGHIPYTFQVNEQSRMTGKQYSCQSGPLEPRQATGIKRDGVRTDAPVSSGV